MTEKKKNLGWRPPKYKTVKELEKKILEYFKTWCRTKDIYNTRTGEKVAMKIPTITWLVLFLGFCDRASFYDYGENTKFSHTIKQARTFMEMEYEELLQQNPTGAIFALKNFWWKDKNETEFSGAFTLTSTLTSPQKIEQRKEFLE